MNTSSLEAAMKRYDVHIKWYFNSGSKMRRCYYGSQVAVILLTASVPLLALVSEEPHVKDSVHWVALVIKSNVLPASLAGLAAVLLSLTNLFQFHKKWLARSFTCEILKSERIKFETRAGDSYSASNGKAMDDDEAVRAFVMKMEQITDNELNDWKQLQTSADGK